MLIFFVRSQKCQAIRHNTKLKLKSSKIIMSKFAYIPLYRLNMRQECPSRKCFCVCVFVWPYICFIQVYLMIHSLRTLLLTHRKLAFDVWCVMCDKVDSGYCVHEIVFILFSPFWSIRTRNVSSYNNLFSCSRSTVNGVQCTVYSIQLTKLWCKDFAFGRGLGNMAMLSSRS